MVKTETRPARTRWTGFRGIAEFDSNPFSPNSLAKQPNHMCGYRVDGCCIVLPIWRRA